MTTEVIASIAPRRVARRHRAIGFITGRSAPGWGKLPPGPPVSRLLVFWQRMNREQTAGSQGDKIPARERLALLQSLDHQRAWRSLSDRRLCVRCTKSFRGWDVKVQRASDGSYELRCPTEGCDSSPAHWLYYGSEIAPERPAPTPLPNSEVDFADW